MKFIQLGVLALTLCFASGLKAQEIYLKFTGQNGNIISGESTAQGMKDNVQGYSFAGSETSACPSTGTGMGGCQTTTNNFFFVVKFDKALNTLRSAMYKGQPLQNVEVTFRKTAAGTPFTYYTIRLETVQIVSISDAASTGGGDNTVQIELKPGKFGYTYITQTGTGAAGTPVKFGWDVIANQEWTGF